MKFMVKKTHGKSNKLRQTTIKKINSTDFRTLFSAEAWWFKIKTLFSTTVRIWRENVHEWNRSAKSFIPCRLNFAQKLDSFPALQEPGLWAASGKPRELWCEPIHAREAEVLWPNLKISQIRKIDKPQEKRSWRGKVVFFSLTKHSDSFSSFWKIFVHQRSTTSRLDDMQQTENVDQQVVVFAESSFRQPDLKTIFL